MGIQRIKLGPKSRFAPKVDDDLVEAAAKKAYDATVAAVKAGATGPVPSDAALAEAAGLLGCGCGTQRLPSREAVLELLGVVHRHGRPCYAMGGSVQAAALHQPPGSSSAATPEPPPTRGRGNVLDDLVAALHERSNFGLRKYGTRLEAFNGRDAHLDALQELLDLFVYLHQARMERASLEVELERLRAQSGCCGKGGCVDGSAR